MTDLDSCDPLNWLSRILWPDGSTVIEPGGSSPQWWASPSADGPKILIPARCPAAARTSVRRYHDGFSPRLRMRSLLAEALMRSESLAGLVLRTKMVGLSGPGSPHQGVLAGIADLMDVPDLQVAVSLSTPKSNQKPVLQLLDPTGRCLGWAKVAWNDRTEALVANEAFWLRKQAPAPLSIPALLHDVEIAGRRVAISSGVDVSRRPRRSPAALPPVDVFHAVAGLGSTDIVPVRQSEWWRSVERVLDHATERERTAMVAAVDSCSPLRLRVGAWHGDLTPWNLMTTAGRVHLIDWEFAADGVPIGFDLCHFHTQVASEMKGSAPLGDDARRAAIAIDHSARLSPHGLAKLGVEPENRTAVWRLYLVELIRRRLALRADGYPTDQISQGSAALDRLERAVGIHDGSAPVDRYRSGTEAGAESPVSDDGQRSRFSELLASDGGTADADRYAVREQETGVKAR
ncbi:MAG: phosphotransferase family protein [Acidimicrobiales bacterium]